VAASLARARQRRPAIISKTFFSLVILIIAIGLLIFGAAGTIDYWQGWLFLASYFAASVVASIWLIRNDPALLERRMRGGPFAEGERTQKIIMSITSLGFIGLLVVPGLDHRFGWSQAPAAVAVFGNILLLLGWLGILFVFRANSYAAATIQVSSGQTVISTGPYGIVRHPMYASALLMLLGIPLALGSWWGVLVWAALLPALAWRLLDEERVLLRDLKGYSEYRQQVRFRLIPFVW
jgi:protein-S-isoprenylcysteine O-methyltransferase Ste14